LRAKTVLISEEETRRHNFHILTAVVKCWQLQCLALPDSHTAAMHLLISYVESNVFVKLHRATSKIFWKVSNKPALHLHQSSFTYGKMIKLLKWKLHLPQAIFT